MVKKINCWEYGEGGKEFKVPHYASDVAACDGNMPHIKATCLILRQYASNNGHLPLFPTLAKLVLIKLLRYLGGLYSK
jgi:hypothetical protein